MRGIVGSGSRLRNAVVAVVMATVVAMAPMAAMATTFVAHVAADGTALDKVSVGDIPEDAVTYDLNGPVGAAMVQETEDGLARVLDIAPTFDGYLFGGTWNDRADGSGTSYGAGDVVEAGTTLYAQWKGEPIIGPETWEYEVTLDPNGGEGDAQVVSGRADGSNATVSLADRDVARDGYELAGWNTAADGTGIPLEGGKVVVSKDNPKMTLYAQWKVAGSPVPTSSDNGARGTTAGVAGGGADASTTTRPASNSSIISSSTGTGAVSSSTSSNSGTSESASDMPQTGVGITTSGLVAAGLALLAWAWKRHAVSTTSLPGRRG